MNMHKAGRFRWLRVCLGMAIGALLPLVATAGTQSTNSTEDFERRLAAEAAGAQASAPKSSCPTRFEPFVWPDEAPEDCPLPKCVSAE